MTSVIVSGMIAATPGHGGAAWAVLQYLLGLRRLGCDVHFVEPVPSLGSSAAWCRTVMGAVGLDERWTLVDGHGATAGNSRADLQSIAAGADLLLNVSGMLTDADVLDAVPRRAYLDLDPAFVQLWHEADGMDMRFDAHTHFVSISDAVGRTIPDCGRTWIPTVPPVVLEHWPVAEHLDHDALTTVANWRGYGSIHHEGVVYGQKAHSLRPLFGLPSRVDKPFLLALGIHPDERDDLEALTANGWRLCDPTVVAGTPEDYRRFVEGSWAEFGVAKSGYVVSDSGWFSDRSACYLAAGRPVVAQDTGFGRRIPTGEGLLAFSDLEGAAAAIEAVGADYRAHRRAARAVAEAHFDSDMVLRRLLDAVLA